MTGVMYRQIIGNALYMIFVMMIVMYAGQSIFELPYFASTQTIDNDIWGINKMKHFTLCWNTFIFLQFFNMINCRDVTATGMNGFSRLHTNVTTWLILLCIFAVQFFACFTWLGRPIFETRGVTDRDFFVTVAAASSILVVNNLFKLIPESLVSKIPAIDEENAVGGENRLMNLYDAQATGELPGLANNFGEKTEGEYAEDEQEAINDAEASDDYRQA